MGACNGGPPVTGMLLTLVIPLDMSAEGDANMLDCTNFREVHGQEV